MTQPLRSDAKKNRKALIAAAREAFTSGEIGIRMADLARRAGVGVGTLYRHFETREALIDAVYRAEVDSICDRASELLTQLDPADALAEFMSGLARHIVANQGLAMALTGARSSAYGQQRALEALARLLNAGSKTGALRADVSPSTLLLAMSGLRTAQTLPGWEEQAQSVVELLVRGLRPAS